MVISLFGRSLYQEEHIFLLHCISATNNTSQRPYWSIQRAWKDATKATKIAFRFSLFGPLLLYLARDSPYESEAGTDFIYLENSLFDLDFFYLTANLVRFTHSRFSYYPPTALPSRPTTRSGLLVHNITIWTV